MTPGTETTSPLPPGLDTLPAQVRQIVGTILGISPDRAIGSAALVADLGATSLDFVELVMAIEDVFGVEIPDTDADRLITVDDLISLVARARAKR
ncbi:acyl carrier protein [Reyranella sp.]|uniref:acyl carrier protein n=1 Tax=Reyranella sp. TaxID=1929291 RepID=UPI0040351638